MKALRRIGLLWIAGWAMFSAELVQGHDPDSATNLYSQGVHAYFAGRSSEAEALLSRAIELIDHDPRLYYFRALSRLQLGRSAEARRDMAAGAALEADRTNRYAVGAALQRVQGSHRLLLEQHRREARSKATTVGAAISLQRAEQMTSHDAGALRERVVIPMDELLRPGGPRALSADELGRRAAAAKQSRVAPATAVASPTAAPATAAEANPFQDDMTPPAQEPSPPAASESTIPTDTAPVEESDDNPFGDF